MRSFLMISLAVLLGGFSAFTQEWVQVASLPAGFNATHHSFGFALDGKGYLMAGTSPTGPRDDFYQYDPLTDSWTELPEFPGTARSFAIGDIWDGKAYFGFGTDDSQDFNDLWVFDPTDMSWTELASCPCNPRIHPALVAENGKVHMGLGGGEAGGGNKNDWWEYDIATDTWSEKPDFPGERRHHPFQFGIDGYTYVGFGHGNGFISNRWYRYEPITEDWQEMATLPAEGRVAGAQFSHNGLGYVLSGDGDDHSSMETGEFWSYDPLTDEWTELPPHPSASRWAPASFVLNGEVYLLNGTAYIDGNNLYQPTVFKYSLEGDVSTTYHEENPAVFQVFPNPFSSNLQLDWEDDLNLDDATLKVFDVHHRLVFSTSTISRDLNLAHLPNGWLKVELTLGDQHYYQAVLKQ